MNELSSKNRVLKIKVAHSIGVCADGRLASTVYNGRRRQPHIGSVVLGVATRSSGCESNTTSIKRH